MPKPSRLWGILPEIVDFRMEESHPKNTQNGIQAKKVRYSAGLYLRSCHLIVLERSCWENARYPVSAPIIGTWYYTNA
jgi:hypothetical protein